MYFVLIGSKDDQRTFCVSYCELLSIGGLKTSIFITNFETKHNDMHVNMWTFFKNSIKEKEIKKLLHHAATNSYNTNIVGVAYCIAVVIARAGKSPTVRKGAYYEQGRK